MDDNGWQPAQGVITLKTSTGTLYVKYAWNQTPTSAPTGQGRQPRVDKAEASRKI